MHPPIRPPNDIELRNLQSLLSTGEPYEILECELESSKKEVQKKFRDLARKYHPDKTSNNDGGDMMTKINNAYSVLNDERLREIYDIYMYERFKSGQMEDGTTIEINETQKTILVGLSLFFSVVSWPFSKIAIIAQSSESRQSYSQIIKSIYKQNGIRGFFRGSIFLLSSGVIEIIKDFALNKIISQEKLPPRVYQLLDKTIRPILKHPYRLIMDLIDIAPLSMTLYDIIYQVILKQNNETHPFISNFNKPFQIKNFFYGAGYTLVLLAAKKGIRKLIDRFDDYCYYGYIKNPTNLFFRYSNYIMKHTFLHNGIVSLFVIPFEVLRCQYPRMLLNSHQSGELVVPSPINPISLAIQLYKSNGIMKFFDGFIPFYMAHLMEKFSNDCEVSIEDEDDDDGYDEYYN